MNEPEQPYRGVEYSRATGWVAWVLLGGVLLVLLGAVHLGGGLIALLRPEILADGRADQLLPMSLTALAWLHLLVGTVALVTGTGLLRGLRWARVAGILLACGAALVNFVFVAVYPVWSVSAIALAGVIVFAVAAHGGEVAEAYGRDTTHG
jgi:hypothetical protein